MSDVQWNTDPTPTRCTFCGGGARFDGYWMTCRRECSGMGSYHPGVGRNTFTWRLRVRLGLPPSRRRFAPPSPEGAAGGGER